MPLWTQEVKGQCRLHEYQERWKRKAGLKAGLYQGTSG